MKKIDDDLGGTTPEHNFKISNKVRKIILKKMNLMNGMRRVKIVKIKRNIGLPGTRWIK